MSVNNTETARTITINDAIMDLLSLQDQAQMALHLGAEVSEAEVRDTISQAGYEKLFATNNHALAELMINEEDETMTETNETTPAVDTDRQARIDALNTRKNLKKDLAATIVDLQDQLAAAQTIVTTRVVESAAAQTQKKEQAKPSRSLAEEKHAFFKWLGWFDLMNQGQINWLKTDNANMGDKPWLCIKYVREGSTVKISWTTEAYKGAQGDCAQIMDIWRALARQKGCKVWKNVQLHIVTK